jgi:hypothetical protein
MLEKIKAFWKSHPISTHSIVVFTIVAVTAYNQVPQLHDYVLLLYGMLPVGVRNLIEVVVAVIAWYWSKREVWSDAQRAANRDGK